MCGWVVYKITQHLQYLGLGPAEGGGVAGAKYAWTLTFGELFCSDWRKSKKKESLISKLPFNVLLPTKCQLTLNRRIPSRVSNWQSYNSILLSDLHNIK